MNHKRRADITISGSLNRRKIMLWFGICTIISIVAILLSQNEIYLDDWYIEACADGAFGENNRSLLVLGANFLLTGMIYLLSLTGLRLFWLHWILLFANYVSYLMVGWILFECLEIKRAGFVTALYGIIMAPLISFEFQFTTTAAVTIASGCLFMMYAIERRKKKRWYIFSTIWIIFGAAMRVDCIVYSVAFFGIVWLKKLIDTIRKMPKGYHEKIQEFFRRLIPFATALLLCFGVEVAQHILMSRTNPGFYDWNNSRTLVDDYEHPDYFANEAAYQGLGVSYTDFLLLCSWNNQDPDFFTQDLYKNLHEIKSNTSESTESDLSAVMTVRNAMLSNDYLWIALLVGGIVGIFFEWKIAVTLGGMFTAAVAFYVYFEQIGRLIWRTEWPIWICFITALIILLQGEKLRLPVTQMGRIKKACMYSIVAALILFVAPFENMDSIYAKYNARMHNDNSIGMYLKSKVTGEETQYATYSRWSGDYFSSRKANIYFSLWANNWLQQYPIYAVDTLRFINVGSAENWGSLGQYVGHLAPMKQNLKNYGIANPIRDLVHDNVRIAVRRDECASRTRELLDYLREHYYNNITFSVDEVIDEAISGRYISGKPSDQAETILGEPGLMFLNGSELSDMDTIEVDTSSITLFQPDTDEGYLVLTNESGVEYTFALTSEQNCVILHSNTIVQGEIYRAQFMFLHNGRWYATAGNTNLQRNTVVEETLISNLDLDANSYNNRAAVIGFYDWEEGYAWTQQYSSVSLFNYDIDQKGLEAELYVPEYPNFVQNIDQAQGLEMYVNGKLVATEPLQPGYHTIIIPPEEIPITESEQYIVELVCPYYVNRAKELGEADTRNVSLRVSYIGENRN